MEQHRIPQISDVHTGFGYVGPRYVWNGLDYCRFIYSGVSVWEVMNKGIQPYEGKSVKEVRVIDFISDLYQVVQCLKKGNILRLIINEEDDVNRDRKEIFVRNLIEVLSGRCMVGNDID